VTVREEHARLSCTHHAGLLHPFWTGEKPHVCRTTRRSTTDAASDNSRLTQETDRSSALNHSEVHALASTARLVVPRDGRPQQPPQSPHDTRSCASRCSRASSARAPPYAFDDTHTQVQVRGVRCDIGRRPLRAATAQALRNLCVALLTTARATPVPHASRSVRACMNRTQASVIDTQQKQRHLPQTCRPSSTELSNVEPCHRAAAPTEVSSAAPSRYTAYSAAPSRHSATTYATAIRFVGNTAVAWSAAERKRRTSNPQVLGFSSGSRGAPAQQRNQAGGDLIL
jgi:hypothetical protein